MPFKVGIIGVGRKGMTIDDETRWLLNYDELPCSHASAYAANEETQVAAIANPGEDAFQDFRRRYGEVATYRDAREMLEREKLDIVSVVTHAHLHAEMTIAAAESGVKGIICEKAMATSLEECDAMIEACRANNVKLLVNHPRRFHPMFQIAKEQIQNGAIGEVKLAQCTGYGKLMHNGSHTFDVLRDFFGDAAWVQGELVETDDPADPDGRGLVQMKNGVAAFVDFASVQPFGFTFSGIDGQIVIDQWDEGLELNNYELQDQRPGRPWFSYSSKRAVRRRFHAPQRHLPPMQAAVAELVAAIQEDRAPIISGEDGRAALELGLAMHASAHQDGARVPIPFEDKSLRVVSR
ncbi:MAG: Gfo/Idh/MocA family oxidoreductase [Armatimonadota bacterium]|nr:Gfo/Idh/MocA family oxidoreductase [Armatimonadota bacterium]